MTTLEDLYYGNIIPVDHSLKQGSAYSEVLKYSVHHQENLLTTLLNSRKKYSKSSQTANPKHVV